MTVWEIIGGIVIVVAVAAAIFLKVKHTNDSEEEQEAQSFLESLESAFYDGMMDIIKSFADTSLNFETFSDFELYVFSEMYNKMYDFVLEQISELVDNDLADIIRKILDREQVSAFVQSIFEKYGDLEDTLVGIWSKWTSKENKNESANEDAVLSVEEEDAALVATFADKSLYIDESGPSTLVSATEPVPTAEELKNINPPSDDEPNYDDPNDTSVEVIEEDVYTDSRGRKRSKKTGRYV